MTQRITVHIDPAEDGMHCGNCHLPRWEENANGWAWVCLGFSYRLSPRYWKLDEGYKKAAKQDPSTLRRCSLCKATAKLGEGT